MNRQTKRQMAKQGADKPKAPERRQAAPGAPSEKRVGPREYLREVRGEMKKVAWPTRQEIFNSTTIVVVGLIVMIGLIFAFDWASVHIIDYVFS